MVKGMRRRAGNISVISLLVILVAYAVSAGPACPPSIHSPMTQSPLTANPQSTPANDCGCSSQTGDSHTEVSTHCSSCATSALPNFPFVPLATVVMSVIPISLPSPIHVASRLDRPPQA